VLYSRHQLLLLLALLAAAALGLGVRHWRATHAELETRLEQLDRQPQASEAGTAGTAPEGRRPPKGSRSGTPITEPPVDLNRASADELSRLPGVGGVLAARIVATRDARGAFASVDDLRRVSGVGRVKLERLRALVTVAE
jgi:competence protein ComEA